MLFWNWLRLCQLQIPERDVANSDSISELLTKGKGSLFAPLPLSNDVKYTDDAFEKILVTTDKIEI